MMQCIVTLKKGQKLGQISVLGKPIQYPYAVTLAVNKSKGLHMRLHQRVKNMSGYITPYIYKTANAITHVTAHIHVDPI